MTLVVEDGTGVAGAEAYTSVAEADTYHLARGNLAWGPVAEITKERALRRAGDYMTATYGGRWLGRRTSAGQALDWPRIWAPVSGGPVGCFYGSEEIPPEVRRACMELALRALAGPLEPDASQAVRRERVGPLETEYQPNTSSRPVYAAVERLLAPLLRNHDRMVRA